MIQDLLGTQTEAAWYIKYLRGLFSQNLWNVTKFWLNIFKNKSLVLAKDNFPRNLEVFSKSYTKKDQLSNFILVENSYFSVWLVVWPTFESLLLECLQNCLVDFWHCVGLPTERKPSKEEKKVPVQY